ncbi:sirohydrochlorin chelatase [Primorskyibacter sp. S187A]|uniref:sirohydrochlorin chelatase n=1 Tax=Primorskyibacter sp. S187A TaxID=3415130 RepID=UPI003C79718D
MRKALIVSHGQPSAPEVGQREIEAFAASVSAASDLLDVQGVSLAAPDALEAMVATLPEGAPLYPLFMADGWFTQVQLPKRLGTAPLHILPPFGGDPGLPEFVAGWLAKLTADTGPPAAERTLVVAGHGSGRSPRPAWVTRAFAASVQHMLPFAEVRTGFVEQPPSLEEVLSGLGPDDICLPFFATKRGHVLEDLPEAARAAGFIGHMLEPIGTHREMPRFIAHSIERALTRS